MALHTAGCPWRECLEWFWGTGSLLLFVLAIIYWDLKRRLGVTTWYSGPAIPAMWLVNYLWLGPLWPSGDDGFLPSSLAPLLLNCTSKNPTKHILNFSSPLTRDELQLLQATSAASETSLPVATAGSGSSRLWSSTTTAKTGFVSMPKRV